MKANYVFTNTSIKACKLKIEFAATSKDIERCIYYLILNDEPINKKQIEKTLKRFLYDQGNSYPELNSSIMDYENIESKNEEVLTIAKKYYSDFY
jgi:hypothetical protein